MPSNVTFVQTLSSSLLLTFVAGSSTLAKVTCIASSPEPLLGKLLERLPECTKYPFETLHDLTAEELFGNTSRLLPYAQPHWELLELVLHNILINLRDVEAFNLDKHIAQVVSRTSDDNRLLLTQMALYDLMANNLIRSTGHNEVQYSLLFKQACFGLFETQEDLGGHDALCTFNWAAVKHLQKKFGMFEVPAPHKALMFQAFCYIVRFFFDKFFIAKINLSKQIKKFENMVNNYLTFDALAKLNSKIPYTEDERQVLTRMSQKQPIDDYCHLVMINLTKFLCAYKCLAFQSEQTFLFNELEIKGLQANLD